MISPGLGHAPTMMLDLTAHNMERQLQKKTLPWYASGVHEESRRSVIVIYSGLISSSVCWNSHFSTVCVHCMHDLKQFTRNHSLVTILNLKMNLYEKHRNITAATTC